MVGCRAWVRVSGVERSVEDSDRQFSGAELEERVAEIRAAFRAIEHPLTDEAGNRVRRLLSGETSYEDEIDEISARYTRTVAELAGDMVAGVFTEDDFIQAVVNIPVVQQLALSDSGIPVRGPISELHAAFSMGLISAVVHDLALVMMIAGGHEA